MAGFLRAWLAGYSSPGRFAEALEAKSTPLWGLCAVGLRGLLDALLVYLPVALLGRTPPEPSYLTLLPTEGYYLTLVWLAPLVFLAQWLLGAAVLHIGLRLSGRPSDMDRILNLTGMASLVVGAVLIPWDWFWLLVGGVDQYLLGVSHLLIDIWWFVLVVTGLRRSLGIGAGRAIALSALAFAAAFPLAVLLMRAPF
jgi:hypothetical protein